MVKCGKLLIDSFTQVRVYDSVLVEELNYKAILISEETTLEDVIRSIPHFHITVSYGYLQTRNNNHATANKFTEADISGHKG